LPRGNEERFRKPWRAKSSFLPRIERESVAWTPRAPSLRPINLTAYWRKNMKHGLPTTPGNQSTVTCAAYQIAPPPHPIALFFFLIKARLCQPTPTPLLIYHYLFSSRLTPSSSSSSFSPVSFPHQELVCKKSNRRGRFSSWHEGNPVSN
jgi:hypothetical protein